MTAAPMSPPATVPAQAPTVTIAIPVLNEEANLADCLDAVKGQTYGYIREVLVLDGGSSDRTATIAADRPEVTLLRNPGRIQACALNEAIRRADSDVLVRVDAHCRLEPDYVERCVVSLEATGAAMVGGGLRPVGGGVVQRGIAAAMASRVGGGPARFHGAGEAGPTDTVYLGAYFVATARAVGGYAPVATNEDAEFAHRMAARGGVWFDPAIRSTYVPRTDMVALARQYYRYGLGRARTVRRHPSSLAPRQLAAPLLLVGLVAPGRRWVLAAYAGMLVAWAASLRPTGRYAVAALAAVPTMHIPWAVGFLSGLLRRQGDSPMVAFEASSCSRP